jgi:predicted RNase H-like HicB family nuclease
MTASATVRRSVKSQGLRFNIETERENDGRWIAEIADIPGVLAYGRTENQAKASAYGLVLRVITDRVEKSRAVPESISSSVLQREPMGQHEGR